MNCCADLASVITETFDQPKTVIMKTERDNRLTDESTNNTDLFKAAFLLQIELEKSANRLEDLFDVQGVISSIDQLMGVLLVLDE